MWFKCLFKSKQQKALSNKSSKEQNVIPICQFFSDPCLNYMSWLGIPFVTSNILLWLLSFYFYIYIYHQLNKVMILSLSLSLKLSMSKVQFVPLMLWSPCLCMIQNCPNFLLQFVNVTLSLLFVTDFAFSTGYCSRIVLHLMLSSIPWAISEKSASTYPHAHSYTFLWKLFCGEWAQKENRFSFSFEKEI